MKIFAFIYGCGILVLCASQCKFVDEKQEIFFQPLTALNNKLFTAFDKTEFIKYEYKTCSCPNENLKHKEASIIEYHKVNEKWEFSKSIGSHNKMVVNAGSNWYHLIYYDGDVYQDACINTRSKAYIYIVCDITTNKTEFKYLYEFKNVMEVPVSLQGRLERSFSLDSFSKNIKGIKNILANNASTNVTPSDRKVMTPDCGFVFELRLWDKNLCKIPVNWDPSLISGNPKKAKRSGGTIMCILFFTFFLLYLTGGMGYRKYKLGVENGIGLVPNLDFWRNFLELQRDGCVYFYNNNPITKSVGSLGSTRNDYSSFSNPLGGTTMPTQTLDASSVYSYGIPPSGASYTSPPTNFSTGGPTVLPTTNHPPGREYLTASQNFDENLLR